MVDNKNYKKVLVWSQVLLPAIEFLLEKGYCVVGIDNLSKYGKVKKSYDNHKILQITFLISWIHQNLKS